MRRTALAVAVALMLLAPAVGASPRASYKSAPVTDCPAAPYGVHSQAPSLPGAAKTVALTFDDGPGASTQAILDILLKAGVRATFFNIGEQETSWPGLVTEEAADGFLVANHTWTHPELTGLSASAQALELDEVTAEQRALSGTTPCELRPPYGDYNATTLQLAVARHLSVWLWDVDTEDWEAEGSGSAYWVNRIVSLAESEGGVLNHPVVLMHNQAIAMPATVAALPQVIGFFKANGYRFVDLLGRSGPPEGCGTSPPPNLPASELGAGSRLGPGAVVASPGGQYRLVMQSDGNLVLSSSGRPLWASETAGEPGASALMRRDGDLVVLSDSGKVLWASGTSGHRGARLSLSSNGVLAVSSAGRVLWSAGWVGSKLAPGQLLEPGWLLESPSSDCRLVMQKDGNLVLYSSHDSVLFESRTEGNRGALARLGADGVLTVSSRLGRVLWKSSGAGEPGDDLFVTRDASLLIESPAGTVSWIAY